MKLYQNLLIFHEIIKFKDDSVRNFHTAMWLEDMNHQKQSTVDREKKVLEIIIEIYIKLYK